MSERRAVSAGRYPGPAPAEPGDLPEPRRVRLLLWAILAVALLARGLQAGEGLPYLHSWDEPLVAGRALVMMKTGNLDPGAFVYGTLPTYMDLATDVFHYLWLMSRPASHPPFLASLDDVKTGFDTGWLWYVSHPSFYLWDRWLSALMGTGTVLLTYLIGRRISGRWAGLAGAALLAGTGFHVEESAIGTVDNPMTFFVALAAWGAVAFVQEERLGYLLVALAACGLAVSTKITAGLALLLPVVALALVGRRLAPDRRRLAWLAVPVLPAAAFLAGSPYALLDLRRFLIDTGSMTRVYEVGPSGLSVIAPGLGHLMLQLGTMARNVGWIAVPFILVGILFLVSRRKGLILALYAAAHTALFVASHLPHHRNFLVLYPLASVAFGAGVVAVHRRLSGLRGSGPPLRHAATALVALVAIFLATGQIAALASGARAWRTPETRSRAVDLANALPEEAGGRGVRLGIPQELRIHPDDLARLALPHDVRPWLDLACRRGADIYLMEPARWGSHYGYERKLAGIYESLRPTDGTVVADTDGVAPLSLDAMSQDPRIQIVALGPSAAQEASPCPGSFSAADLAAVNPQRASPEGELIMLNGEPAETPWMLVEPGPYAAVIRAEGTPAQGEKAKLEVAVLSGGDGEPVARREITLGDFPASFTVEFDVTEDAPFAVRLRLVNDYYSPETGEDRNAYVSGIWVVPAPVGEGEER